MNEAIEVYKEQIMYFKKQLEIIRSKKKRLAVQRRCHLQEIKRLRDLIKEISMIPRHKPGI